MTEFEEVSDQLILWLPLIVAEMMSSLVQRHSLP